MPLAPRAKPSSEILMAESSPAHDQTNEFLRVESTEKDMPEISRIIFDNECRILTIHEWINS